MPNIDVNSLYKGRLVSSVSKIVCSSLRKVWSEYSETDLVLVTELVKEFFTASLLDDILTTLKSVSGEELSNETTARNIIEHSAVGRNCMSGLVLPLLKKCDETSSERWLPCIVQLFFVCVVDMNESQPKSALEKVFQVS